MRFFNIQTGQSENEAKLEHPSGKMTLIMTWVFELIRFEENQIKYHIICLNCHIYDLLG